MHNESQLLHAICINIAILYLNIAPENPFVEFEVTTMATPDVEGQISLRVCLFFLQLKIYYFCRIQGYNHS